MNFEEPLESIGILPSPGEPGSMVATGLAAPVAAPESQDEAEVGAAATADVVAHAGEKVPDGTEEPPAQSAVTTPKRKAEIELESRSSGRVRKASRRAVEAETHQEEAEQMAIKLEQQKREKRAKKLAEAKERKSAAAQPPPPPKPAESKKKVVPKVPAASQPHLLVIVVMVEDHGNKTEFYKGPKAKFTKNQIAKLAECHHGAMNDNRKVYQQVMRIIKKNMVQVDDMFYGKEDVAPVKLQCLISEVYSMHFGGFDEE
mmetsp:Transcript_40166/g.78939  ORF Transcript_40166/g.78939 Transcript_40166/m.78939 type:complete len:259 (-) Transcript_40166:211-987(-)|eukprot:CAMPEP_0175140602 /NCGR_PEP_ID=MMETSP0087-20121206/11609_1 /TAXON_ID=136419 /ORGANISM="Unknown Unknown, Strain D1" /LENGTH=258 /DNA_ID=CAMNT_0016423861 /DNA_START=72 /DNA_END=848 /DNA_ORIENTATION=-